MKVNVTNFVSTRWNRTHQTLVRHIPYIFVGLGSGSVEDELLSLRPSLAWKKKLFAHSYTKGLTRALLDDFLSSLSIRQPPVCDYMDILRCIF